MNRVKTFEASLDKRELKIISSLTSPSEIQAFLDQIPYSTEERYRCPKSVLHERKAHCYDGAVFAAAALRRIGHPPRLVNMFAERDDEHLIAVFKRDGYWGAVAKSNFVGLRFREPIYRNLRELVMSYFADYYNSEGSKSLRSYTKPLSLQQFDRLDWMTNDQTMDVIAARLDEMRRIPLLTKTMIARLAPMDERSYKAGMLGIDITGVYQPES